MINNKKKAIIICGTRPEAIKLIPLYLALKKSESIDVFLISSGQHKDMLEQVFKLFQVEPDFRLETMLSGQSLGQLTGRLFHEIDKIVFNITPDLVIVQGDTTTAFVGNMIAFYHRTKIAHIEAGLRTYDKYSPYPEEINRQIIGLTADYHFTPTKFATDILQKEGKKNIFEVGNTVIDALYLIKKNIDSNREVYSQKYHSILDITKKNILITSHRRENFESGLKNICDAINHIANRYSNEINIIFPVHLNPIVQNQVNSMLEASKNIKLISPIPYDELIYLMSNSFLILTDSGGIQEEAPALNVPVIVLRTSTERPEGIDAGCAILAGNLKENIITVFDTIFNDEILYAKMVAAPCPYGDGNACEYITNRMEIELFS